MRCYRTAQMLAEQTLKSYHPLRLDLAVNYSCFMYEILNHPSEACRIAKEEEQSGFSVQMHHGPHTNEHK